MIFLQRNEIILYEKKQDWKFIINYLYNLWYQNQYNIPKYCRLVTEYWYVISELRSPAYTTKIEYDEMQRRLYKIINFGLENFGHDPTFLWMIGYFISLQPYHFFDMKFISYEDAETIGHEMLRKATELEPDNLIARVLYLGTNNDNFDEYTKARKQLSNKLDEFFSENTIVERYFRDIFAKP